MNDITKHKWSDSDAESVNITIEGSIAINLSEEDDSTFPFIIQKRDAIAIAKHFDLSLMDICDNAVQASGSYIPQSEINHIHHIGEIGEMRRND